MKFSPSTTWWFRVIFATAASSGGSSCVSGATAPVSTGCGAPSTLTSLTVTVPVWSVHCACSVPTVARSRMSESSRPLQNAVAASTVGTSTSVPTPGIWLMASLSGASAWFACVPCADGRAHLVEVGESVLELLRQLGHRAAEGQAGHRRRSGVVAGADGQRAAGRERPELGRELAATGLGRRAVRLDSRLTGGAAGGDAVRRRARHRVAARGRGGHDEHRSRCHGDAGDSYLERGSHGSSGCYRWSMMTRVPRGTWLSWSRASAGTRTHPWLTAWPNTEASGQPWRATVPGPPP